MPKATPKPLTEATIRQRVGERSFKLAQDYVQNEAIFDARRVSDAGQDHFTAGCQGSSGGPYALSAMLKNGAIVEAECSCPVGDGGACKHVAALLLTWLARPDDFIVLEDVTNAITQRSKEELAALLVQLVKGEIDVSALPAYLQQPSPTGASSATPADPRPYQKQAAAVFNGRGGYDDDWRGSGYAKQLKAIAKRGDQVRKKGDVAQAIAVYQGVAQGIALQYEEMGGDDEGEILQVVDDCVDGLSACLQTNGLSSALRQTALKALFDIHVEDMEMGGIGMGEEATDVMLAEATPEERRGVVQWVQAAMKKERSDPTGFRKQAWGDFLLDLQKDDLDDESFLKICRETGRVGDLVDKLLELKRVDDATAEARKAADYDLYQMTSLFTSRKQGDLIERLMTERAQTTKDTRIWEWLQAHCKDRKDETGEWQWAMRLFEHYPNFEGYKKMRALAKAHKRKDWDAVREQIIARIKRDNANAHDGILIQIYMDEGDIDAAIALTQKMSKHSFWSYDSQVAKAAEGPRPEYAYAFYQEQVETIVKRRERSKYEEATKLMLTMRKLAVRLKQEAAWQAFVSRIRVEGEKLRAFQEELARANLNK